MDSNVANKTGLAALSQLWDRAAGGEVAVGLPDAVSLAIADVMSEEAQVSHRYALIVQALLKKTVVDADARRLKDFAAVQGAFSARSFAKETVVALEPLGRRLGDSSDPYVSNPLRPERLHDDLLKGKGRDRWQALFDVLNYLDASPQAADTVILRALELVKDRPESHSERRSQTVQPRPTDLPTLVAQSGLEQDRLLDIIEVLESDQPQVIFAGPPGTSKTHVAVALAAFLTGGKPDRHRVVQFHASYGYEEFVEGLRPTARNGAIEFVIEPGAVRRAVEDIDDDGLRVLVLDELNRANLPRVLGELLYAIERRNEPVDLMYTPDFRLPSNLAFIGTMNTADRSIRSIDAAVRRRFQIFEFPPSVAVLNEFYATHDNEVDDLSTGFLALNAKLTDLLDRHHTIGHTFFMDERGMTSSRLRQVWDRQVLPLVDEYLFDQPDLMDGFYLEAFWPSSTGT